MNDEQVNGVLEEIERALRVEDPGFVRRVRTMQRSAAVNAIAVFVLLGVGVVVLTVGLATSGLVPWSIGLAAMVIAVLVDDHHKRTLG